MMMSEGNTIFLYDTSDNLKVYNYISDNLKVYNYISDNKRF